MKKNSRIDDKAILGQLEELAHVLEIEVRYEPIRGEGSFYTGGLCRVKGENILIVHSEANIRDKIETLVRAVKTFDLSEIYIRPALRELLEPLNPEPLNL